MKLRLLTLSALVAGACVTMSAQDNYYTEKWTDNIFVSGAVGIHSLNNDGFQKVTPNFSISLGKYITPVWGTRVQVNFLKQHTDPENALLFKGNNVHCRNFFGVNVDGMVNLSNLLAGINGNRAFEVYGFAGPMVSWAKASDISFAKEDGKEVATAAGNEKMRTRVGASVGLGMKINLNESLALDLEARGGIAPSIFGNASKYRKAEGSARVNIGLTYTFGGKNFKKVADRVIEKEVIREVPKEVIKEVVKEVKVEAPGKAVAAAAVFFKINKAVLSDEGRVNIKLIAEAIKKSPAGTKYQVVGSADKATGSASFNQTLSEKRAKVVYDALIAEGVSASQLEIVAKGGVDPLFFGKDRLSRVTVIECK